MLSHLALLSDSHWMKLSAIIEPTHGCPGASTRSPRKRKYSIKTIVEALVYVMENGIKWRSLPSHHFEGIDYRLVYYYFRKWNCSGILERMLYLLSRLVRRLKHKRKPSPSMVIIDSKTIATTAGTSEQVGYDGNKKIKGRKYHLATDSDGLPVADCVGPANQHDKPGSKCLTEQVEDLGPALKKIVGDGAFEGVPPFDDHGRIKWQVVKRNAKNIGRFRVLPKRWVVERTFAWLSNYRRLAKSYEKTIHMAQAVLMLCSCLICIKKLYL